MDCTHSTAAACHVLDKVGDPTRRIRRHRLCTTTGLSVSWYHVPPFGFRAFTNLQYDHGRLAVQGVRGHGATLEFQSFGEEVSDCEFVDLSGQETVSGNWASVQQCRDDVSSGIGATLPWIGHVSAFPSALPRPAFEPTVPSGASDPLAGPRPGDPRPLPVRP